MSEPKTIATHLIAHLIVSIIILLIATVYLQHPAVAKSKTVGNTSCMFRLIALALVWFIGSYISLVYLLAIFSLVVATFIGDASVADKYWWILISAFWFAVGVSIIIFGTKLINRYWGNNAK